MTNEFKKISNKEETRYVLETSSGGSSSAGSIASVSMPVGNIKRRPGDNLLTSESDTVKQKPRQGPLKTQTGGGKHKDKTKTIPRREKYKKALAEFSSPNLDAGPASEIVSKVVNRLRQKYPGLNSTQAAMAELGNQMDTNASQEQQISQLVRKNIGLSDTMIEKEKRLQDINAKLSRGEITQVEADNQRKEVEKEYPGIKKIADPEVNQSNNKPSQEKSPAEKEKATPQNLQPTQQPQNTNPTDNQLQQPGATTPAATTPAVQQPGTTTPGATTPAATTPAVQQPGTTTPAVQQPVTTTKVNKNVKKDDSIKKNPVKFKRANDVINQIKQGTWQPGKDMSPDEIQKLQTKLFKDTQRSTTVEGNEYLENLLNKLNNAVENKDLIKENEDIGPAGPGEKVGQGYKRPGDKDFLSWRVALSSNNKWVIPRDKEHLPDLKNYLSHLTILAGYSVANDYSDSPFYGRQKSKEIAVKKILKIKADIERLESESELNKEGAPISGNGGAVDNFKQQMANSTEVAYQANLKNAGVAETLSNPQRKLGKDIDAGRKSDEASRIRAEKARAEFNKQWDEKKAKEKQGMAEGDEYNEYSDEVDMVKNNLLTIIRSCKELANTMKNDENLPEWVEEKVSMSKQNMVTVSQYLQSQHDQGHVYEATRTDVDSANTSVGNQTTGGRPVSFSQPTPAKTDTAKSWPWWWGAYIAAIGKGLPGPPYTDPTQINDYKLGRNAANLQVGDFTTKTGMLQLNRPAGPMNTKGLSLAPDVIQRANKLFPDRTSNATTPAPVGTTDAVSVNNIKNMAMPYSMNREDNDSYQNKLQERLDAEVDERSVSQAQARTMAAAAHNPAFAKKVGIKLNVAQEFNRADTGKDISKLPKRVLPKKRKK